MGTIVERSMKEVGYNQEGQMEETSEVEEAFEALELTTTLKEAPE